MTKNRNELAIAVACLLSFAAGLTWAALDYRGDYVERYQPYSDGSERNSQAMRSGGSGTKTPCQNPRNREESDLCAQWRAANAAKQAARWSLWQMLIGILGVIGLGVTLWFNRRAIQLAREGQDDAEAALSVAQKNADAVVEQMKLAKEASYRDLRAYVSADDFEITAIHAKTAGCKFVIRNTGKTPATIRVFANVWIGPFPTLGLYDIAPAPEELGHHKPYINRGSFEVIEFYYPMGRGDAYAAEQIGKLAQNKLDLAFYIYGRIEFDDYMGRERILHFAYRSNGPVKIGSAVDVIPCPFQNHYETRAQA